MISDIEAFSIYQECVKHWGETSQILMAIEELSELSTVLCHSLRANKPFDIERITEEIADVRLTLEQLQYIFKISDPDLRSWRHIKLERTKQLLKEEIERSHEGIGQDE